jgi:hypothetical protein
LVPNFLILSSAHQPHGYEDLRATELGGTKSVPSAFMLGRVKDINGYHLISSGPENSPQYYGINA